MEFSELGCIRRSHSKHPKFPIFRNLPAIAASIRLFVVLSQILYDRQLYYLMSLESLVNLDNLVS